MLGGSIFCNASNWQASFRDEPSSDFRPQSSLDIKELRKSSQFCFQVSGLVVCPASLVQVPLPPSADAEEDHSTSWGFLRVCYSPMILMESNAEQLESISASP